MDVLATASARAGRRYRPWRGSPQVWALGEGGVADQARTWKPSLAPLVRWPLPGSRIQLPPWEPRSLRTDLVAARRGGAGRWGGGAGIQARPANQ